MTNPLHSGWKFLFNLCVVICAGVTLTGCETPPPKLTPLARFNGIGNFDFSPDGKYFYSQNEVRETNNWSVVADFEYSPFMREMWVDFSNDSQRMVLLNLGIADIYEVPSFKLQQRVNVSRALGACLTPDQQSLTTVTSDGKVQRWALQSYDPSVADSEIAKPLQSVDSEVDMESFDISTDGSLIAVAEDRILKVYRTEDLAEVANIKLSFDRKPSTVNRVCILPDNRRVLLITGLEAHVISLEDNAPILKLETFPKFFDTAACWCEQEQAIAITFYSNTAYQLYVQFFDAKTGESKGATPVHKHHNLVGIMKCSKDGKWLVTNGAPGGTGTMELKVWDTSLLMKRLSNEIPKWDEHAPPL